MTCPHCFSTLEPESNTCPQCGVQVMRNITAVMRTSAVWISTGDAPKFFGSLQEVPEGLRQQLVDSTNSVNSGTIVIADRGGRERLIANAQPGTAARAGMRTRRYGRIPQFGRIAVTRTPPPESQPEPVALEPPATNVAEAAEPRAHWIAWAGLVLVLGAAAVIATAFGLHW